MIKLVIFDMAGTSIDEDNVVYKTIQASLQQYHPEISLDLVLEYCAGKEKQKAISDILEVIEKQQPEEAKVAKIFSNFKEQLDAAYNTHPMQVFPGVNAIMEVLRKKGIKVAFNTGYSRPVATKILEKVGLTEGQDIDILVTADDVENGRPAPDMIHLACQQLGIPSEQSIKIGDSQIDIEEGQNAGVKYSIGITTGAQSREMLLKSKPDFILDDALELLSILENHSTN